MNIADTEILRKKAVLIDDKEYTNICKMYPSIGLSLYQTKTTGTKGEIKNIIDDFSVTEIYDEDDLKITPDGKYSMYWVEVRGWDTHHLIRTICLLNNLSYKDVYICGTKDKLAITKQLFCMNTRNNLVFPDDTRAHLIGYTNKKLYLGFHKGNHFDIKIRNVSKCDISETIEEIKKIGGLYNYYGPQRFGLHLNSHIVAKYIIMGDIEKAMSIYCQEKYTDYKKIYKNMTDYLKKLLISSYQSYLWNIMLQECVKKDIDLLKIEEGTCVMICGKYNELILNTKCDIKLDQIEHMKQLYSIGRIEIVSHLFGKNSELSQNLNLKKIQQDVLNEDDVQNILKCSHLKPYPRKIKMIPRNLQWNYDGKNIDIHFDLGKGEYATIFLREIMK